MGELLGDQVLVAAVLDCLFTIHISSTSVVKVTCCAKRSKRESTEHLFQDQSDFRLNRPFQRGLFISPLTHAP
jgi:hypothetical protein